MRKLLSSTASAILIVGVFLSTGIVAAQTLQPLAPRRMDAAPTVQAVASTPERDDFVSRLNGNTVTIVSGNPTGTYLTVAYDISAVLDNGDDLRVLPIIGKGGAQNVRDILFLRGVDMGITQSNILRYFNETGEVGRNIENRMRYIARLYNEEMHVLVRAENNTLQDLAGKKVNFSQAGSGTQTTGKQIFKDLNIQVQEVNMGQTDAFEAMKQGKIDATIAIAGKPIDVFAKLAANPAYKLIPVPYTPELVEHYLPSELTSDDYPNMIPRDRPIGTIAVSAVLVVFNWAPNTDRYRRVAKFTEAFFANFPKFLEKPRHPKWKEVNLAAELPGWTRFAAAQEILDREMYPSTSVSADLRTDFEQFLTKTSQDLGRLPSKAHREELFTKFLEWRKARERERAR